MAERLLDAAAAVVTRFGLRRATTDEVARAGALFVREVERYLDGLASVADAGPGGAGTVLEEAFVHTLRHVRGIPCCWPWPPPIPRASMRS